MSEGFTCRGCRNFFFQAPKCVSCGAQKLYDSTVKLQGQEIEAQTARIEELKRALGEIVLRTKSAQRGTPEAEYFSIALDALGGEDE